MTTTTQLATVTNTLEYFTRVDGNVLPRKGRPRSGFYARVYNELVSQPKGVWFKYNVPLPDRRSFTNFCSGIRNRAVSDGLQLNTVSESDQGGNVTVWLKLTHP